MSNDYEVGRGKTPKHTRWKKGQSGNPKGRPRGTRNFSTDVKDTLKEPVRLTKGGKPKTVSTQHAALLRLREKALSGDARALDGLLKLAGAYNDEDMAEMAAQLAPGDAEILKGYNARVLRDAGVPQPDDQEETRDDGPPDSDAVRDNNDTPEEDEDDWLR